jgi:hypothetical protein
VCACYLSTSYVQTGRGTQYNRVHGNHQCMLSPPSQESEKGHAQDKLVYKHGNIAYLGHTNLLAPFSLAAFAFNTTSPTSSMLPLHMHTHSSTQGHGSHSAPPEAHEAEA